MKSKIEKQAYKLMNDANKLGLFCSFTSILESMYDTAAKRKQYEKAHIILELINEEFENINI